MTRIGDKTLDPDRDQGVITFYTGGSEQARIANGIWILSSPGLGFDVRAYGAKGDGVTDDTAAIQAGLTAAAGNVAVIPAGTYILSSALTVPNNTTLVGAGKYATTLKMKASVNSNTFTQASSTGVTLRGFGVDMNGTAQSVAKTGILFTGSTDCAVEDIFVQNGTISGSSGIAISTTGVNNRFRFSRCDAFNCQRGITVAGASLDTVIESCVIRACLTTVAGEGALYLPNSSRTRVINTLVTGSTGSGCFVATGTDVEFTGCYFMSNGGSTAGKRGVHVNSGAGVDCAHRFIGCHFELNSEQGLYVESGDGGLVQGCVIRNNNQTNAAGSTAGMEFDGAAWRVVGGVVTGNVGANGTCDGIYAGDQTIIDGVAIVGNARRGVYVAGANKTGVTISGCIVRNNGIVTNAPGIELNDLAAGGQTGHVVVGNALYDDQGTKTQTYAVSIAAAVDRVTVQGNRCFPNKTGAILGTGTNANIGNNVII